MSNFTYAFLALAASGLLFLHERIAFVEVRASTRQLQAQIGSLDEQLSRLEQSRSELERRLAEARDQARRQARQSSGSAVCRQILTGMAVGQRMSLTYFPKHDLPWVGLVAFMTNAAARRNSTVVCNKRAPPLDQPLIERCRHSLWHDPHRPRGCR